MSAQQAIPHDNCTVQYALGRRLCEFELAGLQGSIIAFLGWVTVNKVRALSTCNRAAKL